MLAVRDIIKKILPDIYGVEGEFYKFYLQDTLFAYTIIAIFISIASVTMVIVDKVFLQGDTEQFFLAVILRIAFSVFTVGLIVLIHRSPVQNRMNAVASIWIFVTVLYFLAFNFLRPSGHLTTNIDVLFVFGVYVFSNIRLGRLLFVMFFFSLASIALLFLIKVEVDFANRIQAVTAHILVQLIGLISAIQIQSFRRKAFLAFDKEREASQLAARLLQTDPLTGCLSRRYFFELAEHELVRAKRYAHPLSVLMMDLDHFKRINDQYGHQVGDRVLMAFSKTVIEQGRQSDLFGRLGGEEFGLLLPETDLLNAQAVANRIQDIWAQTDILVSGLIIKSTVSIGTAELRESDQIFEELLHRADMLMYEEKRDGRLPPR